MIRRIRVANGRSTLNKRGLGNLVFGNEERGRRGAGGKKGGRPFVGAWRQGRGPEVGRREA